MINGGQNGKTLRFVSRDENFPFFNSIFWRVNVCSDAYIMRKKRFDKIFILQIYKAIQFVYFTSYTDECR